MSTNRTTRPGERDARQRRLYARSVDRRRISRYALLALLWALFAVPKLMQHASGQTADLDTGNYHNLAWSIFRGDGFASAILNRHHLGEHASPVMVLVALPYLLWPSAYVLMLLQATAVWAAMTMTLAWAARELRDAGVEPAGARWAALAVAAVAILVYPPLLATWNGQFQPIELAMPLVTLGLLLIATGRTRWLWLVVPLLLSTRESAVLPAAGLAIYALLAEKRWRLAIGIAVASLIWGAIAMGVVMPHFREADRWLHGDYVGWRADWPEKGKYLAVMLLGLGPLPFLGRRALVATLAAAPGLVLNVSVDRWTQYGFAGHYDATTAPFLLFAAANGVGWIARKAEQWRGGVVASGATFALLLACSLACWGAVGIKTPFQRFDDWWPSPDGRAAIAEAEVFAERYRGAVAITAHHRLGPHVAGRRNYFAERAGKTKWKNWVWFAESRVRPGHVFLVLRNPNPLAESHLRAQLQASGRARLIESGDYVEVWMWPADAPPPNTLEAHDYAANGYGR